MTYKTIDDYNLILVVQETGSVWGLDMTPGTDSGLVDACEIAEEIMARKDCHKTYVLYRDEPGEEHAATAWPDAYSVPAVYLEELSQWLAAYWSDAEDDATLQAIRDTLDDDDVVRDAEQYGADFAAEQAAIKAGRWYHLDEAEPWQAIEQSEYDALDVYYAGGESRYTPGKAIDYMLLTVDDVELYAETEPDDSDATFYPLLAEIKRQAEENGLAPDWIH